MSQAAAPAGATGSVEVAELGVAGEDDSHVPVHPSKLPLDVVTGLKARFPGAEPAEAELNADDGTPVYKVSAGFNGHPLDVTFTRAGEVRETEQALRSGELPRPVLDWLRQNFPGAVIAEAKLVTEAGAVSYVLLIATRGGQEVEATLRIHQAETPRAALRPDEGVGDPPDPVLGAAKAATRGLSGPVSPADTPAPEAPTEPGTPGKPEGVERAKQSPVAGVPADDPTGPEQPEPAPTVARVRPPAAEQVSAESAEPPAEPADEVRPAAWVPLVAGTIREHLPVDVAAVERALEQVRRALDSLAEGVAGKAGVTGVAARVAIAVAVLAGARRVLLGSRNRAHEPVLASDAVHSSWGWVLGAATPERS